MVLERRKFDTKASTGRIGTSAHEIHTTAQGNDVEKGPLYTDEFASLVARESSAEAVDIMNDMLAHTSGLGGPNVLKIDPEKEKQALKVVFEEGFDQISEEFKDLYYHSDGVGFPVRPSDAIIAKNSKDRTDAEKKQVEAFQAFEMVREGASVKVGHLFPRAIKAVGGTVDDFAQMHLGYAMALTRQVLENAGEKIDDSIYKKIVELDGTKLTNALLEADLVPPSDVWFFQIFQGMPTGEGKELTRSGMIASVVGMFFTNGAWKTAQVPRAIQTGNKDFITPNVAKNFGSYGDMVGGMYALAQAEETLVQRTHRMYVLGSRAGETAEEHVVYGVMRAFYEVAKDLHEARKAARVAEAT